MKGRDFWAEGTVNTQGQWWEGAYPISEDKRPAPLEREDKDKGESDKSKLVEARAEWGQNHRALEGLYGLKTVL